MRLKSTKDIFNNKNTTTVALVRKIDLQVAQDYRTLNHLRGRLLRSSNQKTIQKVSSDISNTAVAMGLNPTTLLKKEKLLGRIEKYKRQNSMLMYSSRNQAVIALCANFEDFIGRVLEKYFEEDSARLARYKQTVSSDFIIASIKRGDNIHHSLAVKQAGDLMYGGITEWYKQLRKIGMNTPVVPHDIHEAFLVRHCIVHNDRKVSPQLHAKNPRKYNLRSSIRLELEDVESIKRELHSAMQYIVKEYSRLFPSPGGTWISPPEKIQKESS